MTEENNQQSTEGDRGGWWWTKHREEYRSPEYAGKAVAVTSKGIIGISDSFEELLEEMKAKGFELHRDYFATPTPAIFKKDWGIEDLIDFEDID